MEEWFGAKKNEEIAALKASSRTLLVDPLFCHSRTLRVPAIVCLSLQAAAEEAEAKIKALTAELEEAKSHIPDEPPAQ